MGQEQSGYDPTVEDEATAEQRGAMAAMNRAELDSNQANRLSAKVEEQAQADLGKIPNPELDAEQDTPHAA